jgi:hypothetical protein
VNIRALLTPLLTPLLTEQGLASKYGLQRRNWCFRFDSLIEFDDPLRKLQRHFVSNAVSSAKKFEHTTSNLGGQNVLRFGEIGTSESTGEQEIWA